MDPGVKTQTRLPLQAFQVHNSFFNPPIHQTLNMNLAKPFYIKFIDRKNTLVNFIFFSANDSSLLVAASAAECHVAQFVWM